MTLRSKTVLAAFALMLGGQAPAPAPDAVVAQRGDVTLTAGFARRLLDAQDPAIRQQLRNDPAALARAIRAQMLQMVVLDEARAKKWDQNPDVIFRAEQARDGAIVSQYLASLTAPPSDYPSETELQTAYNTNRQQFMQPRQFHLAQIFVAVPAGAAPQIEAAAERKAREIRQQLAKPKADFAAIAKSQSDDRASAENGGDSGWVREDQLIAPIKDVARGLKEDALSEPIRAPDGWHIIRMLGSKPPAVAALSDVHDQLVRALRQQRTAQNERAYLEELVRRQPIQLDEIQLQKVVQ